MTETTCRWDRDAQAYMRHGEPCKTDDYGDPTRHCTARGSCANHIGYGELTCARCIARTRQDVRAVATLATLMLPEALEAGVESSAATLAGPACDVEAWSWRKVAARQGVAWHVSLEEDDDERHPYLVLTRWEFMLREDYAQPRDDATSVSSAADYLDRTLPRLAQDDEQDFPAFAREIRKCRSHLEGVLRDSRAPERGAPCPMCEAPAPRLTLSHGHHCTDEECDRLHYPEDPDVWSCPRNREHAWTEEDYRRWVADVYEANRSAS